MTNILKYVGFTVAGIVVGLLISAFTGGHLFGGVYNQVTNYFAQGLSAGASNQFSVDAQGNLTTTATTTITQSVDGEVTGGTFSTAATGTARTVYTNTTGPKYCDGDTAVLYVKNSAFAPSVVFSIGTSTGTTPTTNLVASTTVATSTTALIKPTASSFMLQQGDSIVAIMADILNANASSTYFRNNSAEFGIWCYDVSI